MKKTMFFCTIILCLLFSSTFVKAESTSSILNKLESNASCQGDIFKVGMLGNFYRITITCSSSNLGYRKLFSVSSKTKLNKNGNSTDIIINNGFENSIAILMSGDLPKGYCEVIFKFLNIHPDGSDTNWETGNNTTNNTKFSSFLGQETYYTPYYIKTNKIYSEPNNSNYTYCTMYLYADAIKTTFLFEQYQQWFFGDQKLWSSNVDVIILNNIKLVPVYE